MERLSDFAADIINDLHENSDWYGDYSLIESAINRLAAYEETGLEPEEIGALKSREKGLVELLNGVSCGCAVTYTRLRELAQADREGQCVVLPSDDYTWTIRGDIVRGIIKANCRAAKKEAEAALRREQDEKGGDSE